MFDLTRNSVFVIALCVGIVAILTNMVAEVTRHKLINHPFNFVKIIDNSMQGVFFIKTSNNKNLRCRVVTLKSIKYIQLALIVKMKMSKSVRFKKVISHNDWMTNGSVYNIVVRFKDGELHSEHLPAVEATTLSDSVVYNLLKTYRWNIMHCNHMLSDKNVRLFDRINNINHVHGVDNDRFQWWERGRKLDKLEALVMLSKSNATIPHTSVV